MTGNLDPYIYPGTNVLKNRREILDPERLQEFETSASARRVREWRESGYSGRFDGDHLRAIHRYIFQDVYEWAGNFRTVFLHKQAYEKRSGNLVHRA